MVVKFAQDHTGLPVSGGLSRSCCATAVGPPASLLSLSSHRVTVSVPGLVLAPWEVQVRPVPGVWEGSSMSKAFPVAFCCPLPWACPPALTLYVQLQLEARGPGPGAQVQVLTARAH